MKVLTIYAHPNPRSFGHAVLDQFTAGLIEAGHASEVVDLYTIHFNPVFDEKDYPSYVSPNTPLDLLERSELPRQVLESCKNPLQRYLAKRWLRGKDPRELARAIHERVPKDVREQQRKVAAADALVFIAPVYFVGFPAILKGWVERVFTLGFAFELSPEGWAGDVGGRIPLLHHRKALIISTTVFDEKSYDAGIRDGMTKVMDEWCFRFPGIRNVEHEYFYAMHGADLETRKGYLDRAFRLGRDFAVTAAPAEQEARISPAGATQ